MREVFEVFVDHMFRLASEQILKRNFGAMMERLHLLDMMGRPDFFLVTGEGLHMALKTPFATPISGCLDRSN